MLSKWVLTKEEQDRYINALKNDLLDLRSKAGISQGDLCNILGISRQTYSAIENGRKKMAWPTYLTLIYFFDSMASTRELLRSLPAYPGDLLNRFNEGKSPEMGLFGQTELRDVLKDLDEQAMHSLRTLILVEYARCKKLPGDVVVKAYDGTDFLTVPPDIATEKALQNIRKRKHE